LLLLAGNAFAIFVLIRARGSSSMMAEARRLVTSGIYAMCGTAPPCRGNRFIGAVMQSLSAQTALLLAVQIAF
jgi:hypothetical protein